MSASFHIPFRQHKREELEKKLELLAPKISLPGKEHDEVRARYAELNQDYKVLTRRSYVPRVK